MENDNIYKFIKLCLLHNLPGEDVKVYKIADLSLDYIKYSILINDEFKIELKIQRYDLLYPDMNKLYEKIANKLKIETDFYLNRYIKLKKIHKLINENKIN